MKEMMVDRKLGSLEIAERRADWKKLECRYNKYLICPKCRLKTLTSILKGSRTIEFECRHCEFKETRKNSSLENFLMGDIQGTFEIYKYMPLSELPARDFTSTWSCNDCGREGKKNYPFKSSLRTRARGHLNCRCN